MKRTLRLSLLVLVAAASLTIIAASSWSLATRSARGHPRASPGGETSRRTNAAESGSVSDSDDKAHSTPISESEVPNVPDVVNRAEAAQPSIPEPAPKPIVPHPISVRVEEGLTLYGVPYMKTYWRESKGAEVHSERESRPDGSVRITIGNGDGFTGEDIQIDLSKDLNGSLKAEAVVSWFGDAGPPFDGTRDILDGGVVLNSNDWSRASPLVIEFDIQCHGHQGSTHEKGIVSVR